MIGLTCKGPAKENLGGFPADAGTVAIPGEDVQQGFVLAA